MSNEIQLYKGWTPDQFISVGTQIGRSLVMEFPKSEMGIAMLLEAAASGRTPFAVMRRYHITKNGLLMRADAMHAEFMAAGGTVKWGIVTETECSAMFEYRGQKLSVGFTLERAKKAGWVKPGGAWCSDPESQLVATVIKRGVRRMCPGVIVECGDSDAEPAEAKELNLDSVAVDSSRTADLEPDGVIDVSTEVSEALPHGLPLNRKSDRAEVVNAETLSKLESSFGEVAVSALNFLRSNKTPEKIPWIGGGEGFAELSQKEAVRMLNSVPQFIQRMKKEGF